MAKRNLGCVLNGHEPCHEASNGNYLSCKGCIRHKKFIWGPRGRKERDDFMIKGHCKNCGFPEPSFINWNSGTLRI